ncbi:MAG: hypothetical protein RQM95_15010 [Syntrophaceticus schinkii]
MPDPIHTVPNPSALAASRIFWVAAAQSCGQKKAILNNCCPRRQEWLAGRGFKHSGIGMKIRHPIQKLLVLNHHKLPGLLIVG